MGRGRRERSPDVGRSAHRSIADTTERVRGADTCEAHSDRIGLPGDQDPGRAHCGDPRFGQGVNSRFNTVGAGDRGCRSRVDRWSGRNLGRRRRCGHDGCIGRGRRGGLGRRGGCSSLFGCDRAGSRKLLGGHVRSRILVVGDGWPCDRRRCGRRGGRRRLR